MDLNLTPQINQSPSYFDLIQKFGYYVEAHLKGTEPQTAGNYGVIHVPRYGAEVLYVSVVWATASTDACTLQLEQLTGTTAPGSGNNIFVSGFNATQAANTIYTKSFTELDRTKNGSNFYPQIKQGMRLGWKIGSGSTAQLKDLHMTVYLKPLGRGHFQ